MTKFSQALLALGIEYMILGKPDVAGCLVQVR